MGRDWKGTAHETPAHNHNLKARMVNKGHAIVSFQAQGHVCFMLSLACLGFDEEYRRCRACIFANNDMMSVVMLQCVQIRAFLYDLPLSLLTADASADTKGVNIFRANTFLFELLFR